MQGESWDALYLGWVEALEIDDKERIKIFEDILGFFEKAIRISDECHQGDSPLTETIRAFGQGQKICYELRKFVIDLYITMDKMTKALQQGTLSLLDQKEKEGLINKLKEGLLDKFGELKQAPLLSYFNSAAGSKRPEWLIDLYKKDKWLANKVILAKVLFTTF